MDKRNVERGGVKHPQRKRRHAQLVLLNAERDGTGEHRVALVCQPSRGHVHLALGAGPKHRRVAHFGRVGGESVKTHRRIVMKENHPPVNYVKERRIREEGCRGEGQNGTLRPRKPGLGVGEFQSPKTYKPKQAEPGTAWPWSLKGTLADIPGEM